MQLSIFIEIFVKRLRTSLFTHFLIIIGTFIRGFIQEHLNYLFGKIHFLLTAISYRVINEKRKFDYIKLGRL